jgi:hypothetical protein
MTCNMRVTCTSRSTQEASSTNNHRHEAAMSD